MKTIVTTLILAIASMITVGAQTTEVLTLQGSKGKLYAELQKPQDNSSNKYPLVIICHGFTGNCNETLLTDIADDLQKQGIASLRFDFNGHGKSEGAFQDMTVPNEIDDLKCVIEWARQQPWVTSLSLLGHSQGGVVVSMTAGELGDKVISSVVLMAPAAALKDDALRGGTMGAQYDPWNMKEEYIELWGGLKLGRAYIQSAMQLPIFETAWKYEGPVLIMHGIRDRIVPYTYSQQYDRGYKHSTLELIPDEDHAFRVNDAKAAHYASNWLAHQIHSGR